MNGPVIRAYDAVVDSVNPEERSIVATITTAEVDRFNSVIVTRGGNLKGYCKNPVVLWEHGKDGRRGTDPIGRNLWIKSDGGQNPTQLIAKTQFLKDDFSQQRYEWYRDGILRGFSIRPIPDWTQCSPATREEIRSNPELGRGYFVENGGGPGVFMYRSWELGEYSGTSVPGNANSLTIERSMRLIELADQGTLWLPDEARELLDQAVQQRTMTDSLGGLTSAAAAVQPGFIRKKGTKYIVYGPENQQLSEHDDPVAAQCMLGMPAPSGRSAPDPTDPRIECDGQTWRLLVGDQVILADEDARVVEDAERALRVSRTWDDIQSDLMSSQKATQDRVMRDVQELFELRFNGSV